jgi:cytochrome d ubiquinol oxidase subunit II
MATVWFWLVAFILAFYVVLDGFDLGVGSLHWLIGRTRQDRALLLRTIGPVWDGNEVWLVASGGTLYFAFPLLYASAFSGFYLPLMIVLWLLILRGISVELRSHFGLGIWQDFFDSVFCFSSALLAFFFGTALANVLRGVPLGPDRFFFLPLWTNFLPGPNPGILDWYTLLGGSLALVALAEHGALYLVLKAEGTIRIRARLTIHVRPQSLGNYTHHPAGFLLPAAVAAGLVLILVFTFREKDAISFAGSTVFLAAMLLGAAFALYPILMPSTLGSAYDLTLANAKAGAYGLTLGLFWWGFGIAFAAAYFVFVYWMFRERVRTSAPGSIQDQ